MRIDIVIYIANNVSRLQIFRQYDFQTDYFVCLTVVKINNKLSFLMFNKSNNLCEELKIHMKI